MGKIKMQKQLKKTVINSVATLQNNNLNSQSNHHLSTWGARGEEKLSKHNKFINILMACMILLAILPVSALANHNRYFFEFGKAATGVNDLCGVPLFTLDSPPGVNPNFHIRAVGEYDPVGSAPIDLTPANCDNSIVLATYTDPVFIANSGLPDIDARLKNIPLRENYVISSPDTTRSQLPSVDSVPGNAFPVTKSGPSTPITLGDWLNARGQMFLTCRSDGTAKIRLRYRNLVPNGLYSAWGIWSTTPPGAPAARVLPLPLGGLPNAVTADSYGRASFTRELASCPKDITADGSLMLFIDLAYHSDASLTGAFPQITAAPTTFREANGTVFSSPLVNGAVSHDHVLILISGEDF
jgi:hypothetical protein